MNTPFKVICIQKIPCCCALSGRPMPAPEVMDKDIVTKILERFDAVFYSLERFGSHRYYAADHFATIPDASADEINEAEKESIVPNPEHPVFENILNAWR